MGTEYNAQIHYFVQAQNRKFCFLIAQIGNTESELKKLAEENPDLKDAYIAKQRRLKVGKPECDDVG